MLIFDRSADIVVQVVEKATFLLRLRSAKAPDRAAAAAAMAAAAGSDPLSARSNDDDEMYKEAILSEVIRFVLMPGSTQDIKFLLVAKRSR